MASPIALLDGTDARPVRILQLFEHLELLAEGEPPSNSLFILGKAPLDPALLDPTDELLIVDPPPDLRERYKVQERTAVLFTGAPVEVGFPAVLTMAGGEAHLRIGQHFVDLYPTRAGTALYLPAVGLIAAGDYGSDQVPPRIAAGSDGGEELEMLRLLARLLKGRHFQLFVPRIGALEGDPLAVMNRLAADVSYLHNLRRVMPAAALRGDSPAQLEQMAGSLLPEGWRAIAGRQRHQENIRVLVQTG